METLKQKICSSRANPEGKITSIGLNDLELASRSGDTTAKRQERGVELKSTTAAFFSPALMSILSSDTPEHITRAKMAHDHFTLAATILGLAKLKGESTAPPWSRGLNATALQIAIANQTEFKTSLQTHLDAFMTTFETQLKNERGFNPEQKQKAVEAQRNFLQFALIDSQYDPKLKSLPEKKYQKKVKDLITAFKHAIPHDLPPAPTVKVAALEHPLADPHTLQPATGTETDSKTAPRSRLRKYSTDIPVDANGKVILHSSTTKLEPTILSSTQQAKDARRGSLLKEQAKENTHPNAHR